MALTHCKLLDTPTGGLGIIPQLDCTHNLGLIEYHINTVDNPYITKGRITISCSIMDVSIFTKTLYIPGLKYQSLCQHSCSPIPPHPGGGEPATCAGRRPSHMSRPPACQVSSHLPPPPAARSHCLGRQQCLGKTSRTEPALHKLAIHG